jgi:transcriptional regulator with XRE-family HTH domain
LLEDDPEVRAAYEEMGPAYLVARELLRVRGDLNITQAELARRVGTSQSVISRLENMETSPNLRTVVELAQALGRRLELRFVDPNDSIEEVDETPDWMFGNAAEFAEGLTGAVSVEVAELTELVRRAQARIADALANDPHREVEIVEERTAAQG